MMELMIGIGILTILGIYCIVGKKNMIKKIIGLGIFVNSVHLLLISVGFRKGGIVPILTPENMNFFTQHSVDPLPQALVLTSIVIQLSITVLALSIVILAYRHFNTLDTDKINRLRG
jgi:multicomponent Na+:H+ antiporter subunit C